MDDEEKTRRIQVCRKERWVKRENVCSFIGPAVGCLTVLRICRHTASTTEWSWLCFVKSSAQASSSLAAWTKQGTLLHTMLKRVSGISKWCRFIQGWKIYALGVENLKWQEENFPLYLAWGLRRCIIHGKKRLPDQWMKILRRHGQNDFKLDSFLLQEVALHKFTLSISM